MPQVPLARAGSGFVDRVRGAMVRHAMIRPGSRVLCAVSGGADSLALCDALDALRGRSGFELVVGHVDHRLRDDSDADARRVQEFARSRGLPSALRRVAVARGSGEAAARAARLGALRELAAEHRATEVALGHTADDRAETLLLFLARGAAARGLGSMAPVREDRPPSRDLRWIRPLCEVTRAQARAHALASSLPFADDPTNADPSFSRNRLRARVVPELEALYPGVARRLSRTAESLAEDDAFLDVLAREHLAPLVERVVAVAGDVVVSVPAAALSRLAPPLRVRALRALLAEVRGGDQHLQRAHLDALLGLLRPGPRRVDLPACVAWRDGPAIHLAKPSSESRRADLPGGSYAGGGINVAVRPLDDVGARSAVSPLGCTSWRED